MARILQIEDNEDIQNILFNLFSEEHEIIQAYSGTEGELLFQSQEIDLVLLDIMLPARSGKRRRFDLCRTVCHHGKCQPHGICCKGFDLYANECRKCRTVGFIANGTA